MSLIDRLTSEDKKKIAKYIDENLMNGVQRIAPVEEILKEWDYCKNDSSLAKLFKDKFILERNICYTETQLDIENKLKKEQVVDTLHDLLYNATKGVVDHFWERNLIASFSGAYLLSIGRLDQNYLDEHDNVLELKSISKPPMKIRLQKGAKVIRILSKIVDYYDIDKNLFEQVRLAQSMAMNTKTLKGTMCLSIHPLDYMTMSDNDSDWSSCMSWTTNGCYRQGTVEMMNSPYVVVAYLKSKNDMNLCWNGTDYDKWNNKKWRELFIVNEDCIVNVKSYPYKSDELTMFCLNWLKELVTKNIGWEYQDTCKRGDYSFLTDEGYHFETDYMYNDIDQDRYYEHFIYEGVNHRTDERTYINYSGPFVCMACGRAAEVSDSGEEGTLICVTCKPMECACCGDYLFPDVDNIHFVGYDETPYCEECYNNVLHTNFINGEKIFHYEDTHLYILDRETKEFKAIVFTARYTLYHDQKRMSDYFKTMHRYSKVESDNMGSYEAAKSYFVYEDELTEEGVKRCEMYGEKTKSHKNRFDFPLDIDTPDEMRDVESMNEIYEWERRVHRNGVADGVYIFNISL